MSNFVNIHQKLIELIGGHGFWDKGGVYTGGVKFFFLRGVLLVDRGVSKEKICGRLRRPIFFSHRGVKFFFLRGVLLVDRGVILQKNDKK